MIGTPEQAQAWIDASMRELALEEFFARHRIRAWDGVDWTPPPAEPSGNHRLPGELPPELRPTR
jgi:hypothetical protein